MSAADTCQQVLTWAMDSASHAPPPMGSILGIERLAKPDETLTRALGRLAAVTAARLRLPCALCGDREPLGGDELLIAFAIGVSHTEQLARTFLRAVPPAVHPRQWLTRHGLVQPALLHLHGEVARDCRSLSPLTQLLTFPGEVKSDALDVAQRFLACQDGSSRPAWPVERASLITHLAEPTSCAEVRFWRGSLLDRLRIDYPNAVVSVYETMMVQHCDVFLGQIRRAHAVFTDALAMCDKDRLDDAESTASLWGAMAHFEGENLDLLRTRRHLGYDYRQGLDVHFLASRLQKGT